MVPVSIRGLSDPFFLMVDGAFGSKLPFNNLLLDEGLRNHTEPPKCLLDGSARGQSPVHLFAGRLQLRLMLLEALPHKRAGRVSDEPSSL